MLLLTPISLHHIIQVPNNWESAEKQMEGSWVCVLAAHLCPTLCDPIDWGWPGSSSSWDFPTRILEWVAIPFSRVSSRPRDQTGSPTLQTDFLPSEHYGRWIVLNYYVISPNCLYFCGVLCPPCYGLEVSSVYVSLPRDTGLSHMTCFGQQDISKEVKTWKVLSYSGSCPPEFLWSPWEEFPSNSCCSFNLFLVA